MEGREDGLSEGVALGELDGFSKEGREDGFFEGVTLGAGSLGRLEGMFEGTGVGNRDGCWEMEGTADGEGIFVENVGLFVGGFLVGEFVGESVARNWLGLIKLSIP